MLARRIAVLLISSLAYFASMGTASAVPFGVGDFVTYTQDDWGGDPNSNPAAHLLLDQFDLLYGGSSKWSSVAGRMVDYFHERFGSPGLPAVKGPPGPLTADLVDPTSTSSGLWGGYVLALQLNADFNDAGLLHGTNAILFGDLILTQLVSTPEFNGYTVRQFLHEANRVLGGGTGTTTSYEDLAFVTQDLGSAFSAGSPSAFAQDHLQLPAVGPVPEPATWVLVLLGLMALLLARPKRFALDSSEDRAAFA